MIPLLKKVDWYDFHIPCHESNKTHAYFGYLRIWITTCSIFIWFSSRNMIFVSHKKISHTHTLWVWWMLSLLLCVCILNVYFSSDTDVLKSVFVLITNRWICCHKHYVKCIENLFLPRTMSESLHHSWFLSQNLKIWITISVLHIRKPSFTEVKQLI